MLLKCNCHVVVNKFAKDLERTSTQCTSFINVLTYTFMRSLVVGVLSESILKAYLTCLGISLSSSNPSKLWNWMAVWKFWKMMTKFKRFITEFIFLTDWKQTEKLVLLNWFCDCRHNMLQKSSKKQRNMNQQELFHSSPNNESPWLPCADSRSTVCIVGNKWC